MFKLLISRTIHSVLWLKYNLNINKNSEYDQEIPQSQTADKPMAPQGRATKNHETPGRQTKQSNQLSKQKPASLRFNFSFCIFSIIVMIMALFSTVE